MLARESEAIQRICGSLEVARNLVERSATVYCTNAGEPDEQIAGALLRVIDLLAITLDDLQRPRLRLVR